MIPEYIVLCMAGILIMSMLCTFLTNWIDEKYDPVLYALIVAPAIYGTIRYLSERMN